MKNKTRYMTLAAVIAALYVVLTYLSALFGLSGQNLIQVRLSEALCILPYFTPAAVPGVTLGCLIANLTTGAHALDIVFGTLATLLGAIGTRLLRKWRFLAPLPPILANTLIVPFVLRYAYLMTDFAMPILFLTVAAGEILSVGVLGMLLLFALQKRERQLFGESGYKEK
ncbi:MAG: QueT transporter family protein [Clostridia bacterium]|nr:QueT transporter family protein [Clostridia bacterium]